MDEYFMKIKEVLKKTGMSETTLYRRIKAGAFPKGVKIGPKAVVWQASRVHQWMDDRVAEKPLGQTE